jgi:hypothetical protein
MNNPMAGTATNPLDQLRDIHLPEPISWWPLAPGWWFVIIGGCLFLGWLIKLCCRHYSARLYRRQALRKLKQLTSIEGPQQLRELFELLKQTAISAYPNHYPASQSIAPFICFMQNSCDKPVFNWLSADMDKVLYSASPLKSHEINELFADAKTWIKRHMPEDKLETADQRSLC